MILVDGKGAVYLKCLHLESAKWRYMDYIDTVPSHIFAESTDAHERPLCTSVRAQKRGRDVCRAQSTRHHRSKADESDKATRSESASASTAAPERTPTASSQESDFAEIRAVNGSMKRVKKMTMTKLLWRGTCQLYHLEVGWDILF